MIFKIKKILSICFAVLLMAYPTIPSFATENLPTEQEIQKIQIRAYETNDTSLIFNDALKVLEKEGYNIVHKDKDLLYILATKTSKVKDVSKALITAYVAKTLIDSVFAVITYGIKSYNVAGDILLIKTEFKEKDLVQELGINIIPIANETQVKINIDEVLIGKRDGRPVGKNNKIKILHVTDDFPYKLFFYKLNKQLEEQKIKRVTL